jgi:hypothetical protein
VRVIGPDLDVVHVVVALANAYRPIKETMPDDPVAALLAKQIEQLCLPAQIVLGKDEVLV